MKIKTITCHDVYNAGASLQAYGLQEYLRSLGLEVQIIDYKPDYLSRHYDLTYIPNPRYRRPGLAQAYLLAKLPGRLKGKLGRRKRAFDDFRRAYLNLTPRRYGSFRELAQDPPEADACIAGSDQIWNPLLPNGRDPAFFLDFVPAGVRRVSYAASFAGSALPEEDKARMLPWLEKLDAISVRETSGVSLVESMGLTGCQVCDPVFLLPRQRWEDLAIGPGEEGYLLLYDFDGNPQIQATARALADRYDCRILSVFPWSGADRVLKDMGPREFLGAVRNARAVLSNSFHATAFAMIFHREFFVAERTEQINARMRDLLDMAGVPERLVRAGESPQRSVPDWEALDQKMEQWRSRGGAFLAAALEL